MTSSGIENDSGGVRRPQVGIITQSTRHDVAAEAQVPLSAVPLDDPRVQAAVITGPQARERPPPARERAHAEACLGA